MPRVSEREVKVILPTITTLTDPQIEAARDAASCMVDNIAADCASDLNDATLKNVELYLSAHLCAVTESTLSIRSETDACSGSSATYGFVIGDGVKGTPFGLTANMLSGGCLADYEKQPVNIISLGTL